MKTRQTMLQTAHQQHPEMSLRRLCQLFSLNRSYWYRTRARHTRPPALLTTATELRDRIERLVLEFPGYGYRRVTKALARQNLVVNHKKVRRIMRHQTLLCQLRRRPKYAGYAPHLVYPNLLAGIVVSRLHQVLVADITYIRLPTNFCYLAAVLDAYSRRVVGWQLSKNIDTELALAALEQALTSRELAPGWIHHSDQGVQYTSRAYTARLVEVGAKISMSAKANPYDNARAESFFATLKREEVYLKDYQTFEEAEADISNFIEAVYNHKRLHSSLGYLPPVEFEQLLIANTTTL